MACNCVHSQEDIQRDLSTLEEFRNLFITRMSKDSDTTDRRRKDFNQAIFFWDDYYQEYLPVFCDTTMEMILECFDNAVKDYRRSFCDTPNCKRK